MTPAQCRHSRLARVHPRMGARLRLRPGFRTACRRCEGRAGQLCRCKCKQLRAFASAPGRVWSRLVAFSRVWSRQFFFLVSGPVWACSVISCHIVSYLVVISRHFSSFLVISRPKFFFPGMAGNGRLRLRLGREGSSLLRMVAAPGAGCASCHDIRFKLVCNCGRAAAVFVYVQHNCTAKSGSLQLLGIPGRFSEWG